MHPSISGWCFDFESGNQLTATQLLQRMGADPAALEEALYRDVKRRDELDRQAACERGLLPPDSLKEGNTAWWATLDELPLSFDEAGNVSFVVRRSSAVARSSMQTTKRPSRWTRSRCRRTGSSRCWPSGWQSRR